MIDLLVIIICNLIIYSYIIYLQKYNCDCANNWKQNVIKYLSVVNVIYNIMLLCFYNNIIQHKFRNKTFINIFKIFNLIMIFYYICVLLYFGQLKNKKNCLCSENWRRKYLLFPIIIPIIILILILFIK